MGLFSSRTPEPEPDPEPQTGPPADNGRPTPVSRDRVEEYLRLREYKYQLDDDGDIVGKWDSHYFFFLFYGNDEEIFQVRGRWGSSLDSGQEEELKLFLNDWNRDHYWPKTYFVNDDGLQVFAEVATDLEHGVTDAQLGQLVDCGLYTGLQFFKEMDTRFGDDGDSPAQEAGE